jgi:hypothetical protein
MELRKFELTKNKWKIATQLPDVLKVSCDFLFSHIFGLRRLFMQILKDATLFFLRSTPNLPTVIPAMAIIDEKLTTESLNHSEFEAPIHAALRLAKKKTLNRYNNMTDSSEVYQIAMGMYFLHFFYVNILIYVIIQSYTSTQAHILQECRLEG